LQTNFVLPALFLFIDFGYPSRRAINIKNFAPSERSTS
jgi:hypothetical protein